MRERFSIFRFEDVYWVFGTYCSFPLTVRYPWIRSPRNIRSTAATRPWPAQSTPQLALSHNPSPCLETGLACRLFWRTLSANGLHKLVGGTCTLGTSAIRRAD